MKLRRSLGVLAAVLVLAGGGVQAHTLGEARAATDARQFDRALAVYGALLRAQPADADLLIEVARVYGFADRHREAIATYLRVLEVAPQRRRDIVAALAWQTHWAGDAAVARPLFEEARRLTREPAALAALWRGTGEACVAGGDNACALRAYQEALALHPGDRDLRRRMALVLLWQDDYAASEAAWRELLAEVAGDRRAQAGLARTLNAAGRHQAAITVYRGLDDGSDAEVRLDHARALRWAGFDREAAPLLAGRSDADAVFLRDWRIARELKPYAYGTIEFSTDADDLDIASVAAAGGTWLNQRWLAEVGYRRARLNSPQGEVGANRRWATLRGAFGTPGLAPPGLVVPSLTLAANDYGGWSPVTGNASVRWLPADLWRLALDIGREVIETPRAISNRVTADTLSLGVETRLPPRWGFAAAFLRLAFSDGNDRNRIVGRFDYALQFKPKITVGLEGAAFEDSAPASFATGRPPGTLPPAGYWNPKRYAEARVIAGIHSENHPWDWYARVALGSSRETDGDGVSSSGHPNLLELGVAYDAGPSLRGRFFAGGSGSSFAVGSGGSGYWRRYLGFTLNASF